MIMDLESYHSNIHVQTIIISASNQYPECELRESVCDCIENYFETFMFISVRGQVGWPDWDR